MILKKYITVFERDGSKQYIPVTDADIDEVSKLASSNPTTELPRSRYFSLRNLAWEVMLQSEVKTMPIDLSAIAEHMGVVMLSYTKHQRIVELIDKLGLRFQRQGFCLELLGRGIICYDEIENKGRQRFTIAHELGHILLHHTDIPVADYEKEANMFGRRILCPMGILKACNVTSVAEIATLCEVSDQAATYAYSRYKMLLERNKFFTSPLERQLVVQFKDYIDEYNKK